MRKIKIISASEFKDLQKNIDKWMDEVNPDIESVSPITFNSNSMSHVYMIAILYYEEISLGGE